MESNLNISSSIQANISSAVLSAFELKELDNQLECPICVDFIKIAMLIRQCSHTFCSLCIRRFLSSKNKCPICNETAAETDLLNNRLVDEIVIQYKVIRSKLLKCVQENVPADVQLSCTSNRESSCFSLKDADLHETTEMMRRSRRSGIQAPITLAEFTIAHTSSRNKLSPDKQIKAQIDSLNECKTSKRSLRSGKDNDLVSTGSRSVRSGKDNDLVSTGSNHNLVAKEESLLSPIDEDILNSDNTMVPCPVCQLNVRCSSMNKHLDFCLERGHRKNGLRCSTEKRKPMTKVVYNLLSDKDLKTKLKVWGLSVTGTRQEMIKRHHEFTLAYNAECDSLTPRPVEEIIRDVEKMDKLSKVTNPLTRHQTLNINKSSTSEEINKAQKSYLKQHKSQFNQLVESVRNRKLSKKMSEKNSLSPKLEIKPNRQETSSTDQITVVELSPSNKENMSNVNLSNVLENDYSDLTKVFTRKSYCAAETMDLSESPDQNKNRTRSQRKSRGLKSTDENVEQKELRSEDIINVAKQCKFTDKGPEPLGRKRTWSIVSSENNSPNENLDIKNSEKSGLAGFSNTEIRSSTWDEKRVTRGSHNPRSFESSAVAGKSSKKSLPNFDEQKLEIPSTTLRNRRKSDLQIIKNSVNSEDKGEAVHTKTKHKLDSENTDNLHIPERRSLRRSKGIVLDEMEVMEGAKKSLTKHAQISVDDQNNTDKHSQRKSLRHSKGNEIAKNITNDICSADSQLERYHKRSLRKSHSENIMDQNVGQRKSIGLDVNKKLVHRSQITASSNPKETKMLKKTKKYDIVLNELEDAVVISESESECSLQSVYSMSEKADNIPSGFSNVSQRQNSETSEHFAGEKQIDRKSDSDKSTAAVVRLHRLSDEMLSNLCEQKPRKQRTSAQIKGDKKVIEGKNSLQNVITEQTVLDADITLDKNGKHSTVKISFLKSCRQSRSSNHRANGLKMEAKKNTKLKRKKNQHEDYVKYTDIDGTNTKMDPPDLYNMTGAEPGMPVVVSSGEPPELIDMSNNSHTENMSPGLETSHVSPRNVFLENIYLGRKIETGVLDDSDTCCEDYLKTQLHKENSVTDGQENPENNCAVNEQTTLSGKPNNFDITFEQLGLTETDFTKLDQLSVSEFTADLMSCVQSTLMSSGQSVQPTSQSLSNETCDEATLGEIRTASLPLPVFYHDKDSESDEDILQNVINSTIDSLGSDEEDDGYDPQQIWPALSKNQITSQADKTCVIMPEYQPLSLMTCHRQRHNSGVSDRSLTGEQSLSLVTPDRVRHASGTSNCLSDFSGNSTMSAIIPYVAEPRAVNTATKRCLESQDYSKSYPNSPVRNKRKRASSVDMNVSNAEDCSNRTKRRKQN